MTREELDLSETIGDLIARITAQPGGYVEIQIVTAETVDYHAWAAPDDAIDHA